MAQFLGAEVRPLEGTMRTLQEVAERYLGSTSWKLILAGMLGTACAASPAHHRGPPANGAGAHMDVGDPPAMPEASPATHVRVSKAATDGAPMSPQCTALIARTQYEQDVLYFSSSPHHFDNCCFDEGMTFIRRAVEQALDTRQSPASALTFFAAASHAIQDFYFHSNYIELSTQYPRLEDVPIVRLWAPEGKAQLERLREKGLVSGTVAYEFPKRCADGTPSHGEMAKDNDQSTRGKVVVDAWGVTLFDAAVHVASAATRLYWAEMLAMARNVATFCEPSPGHAIGHGTYHWKAHCDGSHCAKFLALPHDNAAQRSASAPGK
jgi:hypothetical protein